MKGAILFFTLVFAATANAYDYAFVTLGDTGTGKEGQFAVAKAIEDICKLERCEFAVLLGDNFYDEGVTSVDDPQFQSKLEEPYKNIDLPFYMTLGNHDYGKYANDWKRGQYQIDYTAASTKWFLPNFYYSWDVFDTRFIVLDTSRLFWNKDTKKQMAFVESLTKDKSKQWTIVFAHHPYISNGEHGNAGEYDGVLVPPFSGNLVKRIYDRHLCNKADLFMNGHDHNIQVLKPTKSCPHPFIISGGGAKVDDYLKEDRNPFYYQRAGLGFHLVKVYKEKLVIHTINDQSIIDHTLVVTKSEVFED